LISPYQDHDLLKAVGHELAQAYGLVFMDDDLRIGYRESIAMSKEFDLYRQPYCGCIYSEKERYYKPLKGDKR
jgi:predicted adenine nucleotide alpha hydrolase (AANH) superfamily ATPase